MWHFSGAHPTLMQDTLATTHKPNANLVSNQVSAFSVFSRSAFLLSPKGGPKNYLNISQIADKKVNILIISLDKKSAARSN